MNKAVILTGTNEGDLSSNLELALELVSENTGKVIKTSGVYETEPWGRKNQPVYYNQVFEINTPLDAFSLMKKLLSIEKKMGRERTIKWAPRLIDLDILYFNDEIINTPELKVPHPHLHDRRFTLVPLTEILPDFIHPVLKKTSSELLQDLADNLNVKPLKHGTLVKY